jgi:hypothetical protein
VFRKPTVLSIFVQGLAALFVVLGLLELQRAGKAESFIDLARRIESGSSVDPAYVAVYVRRIEANQENGHCRASLLRAELTILLHHLDLSEVWDQPDARSKAVATTLAFLDRAEACLPTDGNIPLRRAMVSLAAGGAMPDVGKDMRRSQHFAPAERNILSSRYRVWNVLDVANLQDSRKEVLADIASICSQPDLVKKLPPLGRNMVAFLQSQGEKGARSMAPVEKGALETSVSGSGVVPRNWCDLNRHGSS